MEQLVLIKSKPKNNFFAPEWCYYIYENIIDNVDFKKISKLILKKEKEIIKKYKPSKKGSVDGYTGLGKNSLTSRYEFFNVLKWKDKEIDKLEKQIIERSVKYYIFIQNKDGTFKLGDDSNTSYTREDIEAIDNNPAINSNIVTIVRG